MKKTKIFTLIAIVCLLVACFGCSGKDQGDEPVQPEEITADVTMENFVKKLEAGNYVIDAKDYVKTVAVSPEKVYFVHQDVESGLNRAFVTKDGETFEIRLTENGTDDVAFVSKDNAINVLTYLLPNYWINYTGNMFDLFYNNVDDPLEFTSHDEAVKTTLLGLGGYGQMALSQMEDVHMVLDAADPSSVHFTAVIHDVPAARIYYDDLDLTLQFGAGETDPRIEEWIKNPTYPETRTCWSIYDIGTLESVFYKDYGELAVPFPSFASYAMNFDSNAYMERTEILLTDAHGTEEDVENYIKVLTDRGYKKATKTLEDGSTKTVYRLLLREAYHAYAELEPVYNDGFELTGRMYYDNAVYDGQQAISDAVVKHGFEPLEETDLFTGWVATDTFAPRSEGWIYFFDYDMYLEFPLEYKDFEAAKAYLDDYGNKLLEKGFVPVYTPNENDGKVESPNGCSEFLYTFDEEGSVLLTFRKEKTLTAEEARKAIAERGIPEPDLHGDISTRDITRYHYNIGEFRGLFLDLYQPFTSEAEAEQFLDSYVAALEEAGFEFENPQRVGSYRSFVYYNEEARKYVGFDLNRGEGKTNVFFEFVSIEPEEESILQSVLRR